MQWLKTPVRLNIHEGKYYVKFKYNKKIIESLKISFKGARWNPEYKCWTFDVCPRNEFWIRLLCGLNPFERYDEKLIDFEPNRSLYEHQYLGARHLLTRRRTGLAFEMGSGKTLATIEAIEASGKYNWLWVGPKSALYAVKLEFLKWKSSIVPHYVNYASLKKLVEQWPAGKPIYDGVVFDESQKLKTPNAQRSQAAMHIADAIREEHDGYVFLLSGSPAPKSPIDWWHQAEIACPGFLKERDIYKFRERLAVVREQVSGITGGTYNEIASWKDDPNKCNECGGFQDEPIHDITMLAEEGYHKFTPSKNEIVNLNKRLDGLFLIKLKKDCLDLPEKQYEIITCEPSKQTLRLAELLAAKTVGAAKLLILLRELSDGFQYKKVPSGKEKCPICEDGTKEIWVSEDEDAVFDQNPELFELSIQPCPTCKGTREIVKYSQSVDEVTCPKDGVILDLLENYKDVGRQIIYAGFTGSVDRCVKLAKKAGWDFIRADGRGWLSSLGGGPEALLSAFDDPKFEKICFIGHPKAAGTGLNLTASQSIIYYSNDFDAEARIQSEDRIHRPGCKGAMIYDIFHLPTDNYIYENLKAKRKLQSITMGEIKACLK